MADTDYSDFLDSFQFVTTYPFLLAVAFNRLRERNAQLNQGSLFTPITARGVSRRKLLLTTVVFDTPLMIALSLGVGKTPAEEATLILQSLACLYTVPAVGYFLPFIDVATYMVNFAPFLMVTRFAEPLRTSVEGIILYAFSGEPVAALLPASLGVLVGLRVALGLYRKWIVPGVSGFAFAIALSIGQTAVLSYLPSVGKGAVLQKALMTVTTAVMMLSYTYLRQEKVVVMNGDSRRVNLWTLTSVYSAYAALTVAVGMWLVKGEPLGFSLIVAFASLQAGCAVCLGMSTLLTTWSQRLWRWFYSKTQPVVDDGASAIVSKLVVLCLQGLL